MKWWDSGDNSGGREAVAEGGRSLASSYNPRYARKKSNDAWLGDLFPRNDLYVVNQKPENSTPHVCLTYNDST